ncbi:hypothetical protein PC116_g26243 [Phytophthora cactorum]|nr:hypothetical protein PC116_g26243 [Phytophthora cactorum]
MEDLRIFDSMCKKLQDDRTTMAEARLLFISLLEKYPTMEGRLEPASKIVHSPRCESAAIKVARGSPLTPAEAKTISKFVTLLPVVGEKRKSDHAPNFPTTILLEGAAKLILTPQRALSWLLHRAMKRPEWRGAVQLSIVFPDH